MTTLPGTRPRVRRTTPPEARPRRISRRRLARLSATVAVASTVALLATLGGSYLQAQRVAAPGWVRLPEPTAAPAAAPTPVSTPPPTSVPTPQAQAPAAAPAPTAPAGTGKLVVAPGSSDVSGAGPVRTFIVEVEDGLGTDPGAFAADVEAILFDERSWGGTGRVAFRRVESGGSFRITLATPELTRRLCRPYDTGRTLSCYNGARAVINAYSWTNGKPFFPDLATYRTYQINHEVGHALGHRHRSCPGPGQPAPVMQQQSKGLDGCTANGWPLPSERG